MKINSIIPIGSLVKLIAHKIIERSRTPARLNKAVRDLNNNPFRNIKGIFSNFRNDFLKSERDGIDFSGTYRVRTVLRSKNDLFQKSAKEMTGVAER